MQALLWLLGNVCNNGFSSFLNPESSIILDGHPLKVTSSKQAALGRGKYIFTETFCRVLDQKLCDDQ